METVNARLRLVRTSRWKYEYEIRDGERALAAISLNSWNARATVLRDGMTYHLDTKGWLRREVTLTPEGAQTPTATFRSREGILAFNDGRTYRWKKPRRLTRERLWEDASGATIATFAPGRGETTITLSQPLDQGEVSLLLVGAYLMALSIRDDEAATVAAVVAVVAGA